VRTVYALADTVTVSDTTSPWSPVYGNAALFAVMCLLMEYITLCLYMWVGLTIPCKPGKLGTRSNRLREDRGDSYTAVMPDNTMA
jgi:hypothetical protein